MSTELANAIVAGRWADAEELISHKPDAGMQGVGPLRPQSWGDLTDKAEIDLDVVLPNGETLLQLAVEARYPAFLRRLLEVGADPNRVNAAGDTPLIVSCRGDFAIETGVLLEFGADPNYRTTAGWTALRCAAKDRNYAAVRILLAKGATIPESGVEQWAASLDAFAREVAVGEQ